jgi:hypothetical protein
MQWFKDQWNKSKSNKIVMGIIGVVLVLVILSKVFG